MPSDPKANLLFVYAVDGVRVSGPPPACREDEQMSAAASTTLRMTSTLRAAVLRWGAYLGPLLLPVGVLIHLTTRPHGWYAALPWIAVIAAVILLDRPGPAGREPLTGLNARALETLLFLLFGLHIANILALALVVDSSNLLDTSLSIVLVGATSGYSAVITAHELIHRRERHRQVLGRMLLWTAFYDRFFVDHLRGHHARAASPEDPATARFDETFVRFALRTIPAEFKSAWELEARRLRQAGGQWKPGWLLRHAMAQGFVAELVLMAGLLGFFGPVALAGFVLQALVAQLLIAAVNYFEHWGLSRQGRKSDPADAWDCDSRLSQLLLLNLPRHPDHHLAGSRPYYLLGTHPESPRLPHGYIRMIFLVTLSNRYARRLLTEELRRRELGPFLPESGDLVSSPRSS